MHVQARYEQTHLTINQTIPECATFGSDVRNYVGCSPGPACDGNGGLLDLVSPYRRFTRSPSPVLIVVKQPRSDAAQSVYDLSEPGGVDRCAKL